LQYLENPYQLLEEIQQLNKPYIILDRTTVNFESQDIITKQHVPNYIYEGNYPCWFLSEQKLLQSFAPHYKLIHSFQSYCEKPSKINGKTDVNWKGYVFERVSP
jgi:putative methyltransferase (TIGR04325 family)